MSAYQEMVGRTQASIKKPSNYLSDILSGNQLLSGSDLMGKAKTYGSYYYRQRKIALTAWTAQGGTETKTDDGTRELAVAIGMDDFGNALFQVAPVYNGNMRSIAFSPFQGQCAVQRTKSRAARIV